MTKPDPVIAKWTARLAEVRKELEEKAASGDERAAAILRELDGEPQRKVDAVIPGPPVKPWCETEREPGED